RYVIEDKDVSVIVTVKPDDFRETGETFEAKLLDLSQNGARLVVPNEVPNTRNLRLQVRVDELGLELHLAAGVCWCNRDETGRFQIGCEIKPGIPPRILEKLSEGGKVDRRIEAEYESPTELHVSWTPKGRKEVVRVQNFSRGGFCIFTNRDVVAGAPFHFTIMQKNGDPLIVGAKIQWRLESDGGYLVGCSFLTPKDLQ
ncbi:MAG: PilZ domain-containing protein, partial [Planctomycetales bacterium]|nr:PilZ domain-containing protein [Planctomycetales bacterium]